MQDNIRINTPAQQLDPNSRIRPAKDPPIINPIDPTRVAHGTNAANAQQAKDDGLNLLLNQNSVFNRFISQLANTPGLSQTLKKVMFEAFSIDGKPIKAGQVNSLLAELSDKLKLSPDQIVEALNYQSENQTKFSGGLFDMMRELLSQNSTNKEFETLLGRFLKAYNGFFSVDDTLKAVITNLKQIASSMPKSHAQKLDALVAKILVMQPTSNLEANLQTLKTEVIPFLSNYIGVTNDFGKVRDTITLLINNIARLNNSSHEEVVTKFVDLIDFCKFSFDMSDNKIDEIKNLFARQLGKQNAQENMMFDTITRLLSEGSSKEQSFVSRTLYKDIATTLLLDNSVFMPLTHLFLPINYNGQFMFSEVWIEKDGTNKTKTVNQKPITKLLLNFDIKGLGFFEATLWISEGNVDVELNCPSTVNKGDKEIKDNVSRIFHQNGMNVNHLALAIDAKPKRVQDVFKSLFDARRGVNVTV